MRSILGAVAALTFARVVSAEPVHLSYDAFDGCPSSAEFFELVRARTPRAELAPADRRATRYEIALSPQGDAVSGRLVVIEPDGPQRSREVSGESCGDVASALALVVALAIDPDATSAPAPPPAPPPTTPPAPPAPPSKPPVEAPRRWLAGGQLAGTGLTGAASALGFGAFLEHNPGPGGLPLPRLRLTALFARESFSFEGSDDPRGLNSINGRSRDARVDLFAARLEGCPFVLAVWSSLHLVPCAGVELGVLRAQSDAMSEASRGLWLAPVVTSRVQWLLGRRLVIEAQASGVWPLIDHHFVLEAPRTVVQSTPGVSLFAGLGLGVRF